MKPFEEEGFVTFKREVDADNRAFFPRKPTAFLSPKGHISFNNGATRLLMGKDKRFTALRLAYNPHTKILVLKPEVEHVGFPETVKLVYIGAYRRSGVVSFKSVAEIADFEFTGKRYPVTWNRRQSFAEIDLNHPMADGEKPKRLQAIRPKKVKPEQAKQ